MRLFFCSLLIVTSFGFAYAETRSVFTSSTEDSTIGWHFPAEKIAIQLVNLHENDKANVDEKISEDGLKKNYRQFFAIKKINLSEANETYTFIRPRSEIYSTFYGAHIFRFWILDKNSKIIFADAADTFSVSSGKYHGMSILISSSCYRGYCFETTYVFSKGKYSPSSCLARSMADTNLTKPCE